MAPPISPLFTEAAETRAQKEAEPHGPFLPTPAFIILKLIGVGFKQISNTQTISLLPEDAVQNVTADPPPYVAY